MIHLYEAVRATLKIPLSEIKLSIKMNIYIYINKTILGKRMIEEAMSYHKVKSTTLHRYKN